MVACVAPAGGAGGFLDECEGAAASAKLNEGRALDLEPDNYLGTLNGVIKQLNAARGKGVADLRKAGKAGGQAQAAARVAKAYGTAAGALARATVGPEQEASNRDITAALGRTRDAYRRMAAAARSRNSGRYDAARADARRGEQALKAALGRVESGS